MVEGGGRWALPTGAVLRPSQLTPRLFSVSCADCAEHQEPPRKKLLSEKKLVSLVTGKELGCGFPLRRHWRCFEFLLPCRHSSSFRYWQDTCRS